MLLCHGEHCAASSWHHFYLLGYASHSKFMGGVPFSPVLGQFLIVRQYRDGHFLCAQSWQDCAGCCAMIRSQGYTVLAPRYLGMVCDHFSHFWPNNDSLLERMTLPPPLNLTWVISRKFANLMGQKNICGIVHSNFNPTLNLCPWRDSSCLLTKIDENSLGTPWGDLRDENFKGDHGHLILI